MFYLSSKVLNNKKKNNSLINLNLFQGFKKNEFFVLTGSLKSILHHFRTKKFLVKTHKMTNLFFNGKFYLTILI